MAIYGIYACENTYGGTHGMNDKFFIEGSLDVARECLIEASEEVISSYGLANQYLESEEDDEEYDEDRETEVYADLIGGYIMLISESCPYTVDELNDMSYDNFEELCEQYGTSVDW